MSDHHIFPASLAQLHAADTGHQWRPSNGTEGQLFIEAWCCDCQRDRALSEGMDIRQVDPAETCPIVEASFRGEAVEWQIGADGQPRCTAWVPAGETVPRPRCTHTLELPL